MHICVRFSILFCVQLFHNGYVLSMYLLLQGKKEMFQNVFQQLLL